MKKILVCGFCTQDFIRNKSYFGGAAGGIALNLASLGVNVGILSVLGEDNFSKEYKKELLKKRVDISLVLDKAGRIPYLEVIDDKNSEFSRKFNDNGTKDKLEDTNPDFRLLNSYSFLHAVNAPKKLCNYLAQNFKGDISYCPGSLLVRDHNSLSDELASSSKFIFCNQEEYEILEKKVDFNNLFNKKLRLLLVTKGEKGVTAIYKDKVVSYDSIKVKKLVDTTGGGDAFALGFIKAIMDDESFDKGIKYGIKLASIAVQSYGVTQVILSKKY
ncbi:MAG: PfkB family carbohydrate kinase [Candidatus Levybacteria bacterium]|nr:PfkB family carbohydrate kinase [Candidatus Levybacteria bacterium]